MPNAYKPIITIATNTMVNDKAESVLIAKVLCTPQELKHISECIVCEHHEGVPNNFCVQCAKKEEDAADSKEVGNDGEKEENAEEGQKDLKEDDQEGEGS